MLSITIKLSLTSEKPPLHISHNKSVSKHQNNAMLVLLKQRCFPEALHHQHSVYSSQSSSLVCGNKSHLRLLLIPKWYGYPVNSKDQMPCSCNMKLKQLYQQVKQFNSQKCFYSISHKTLVTDIITSYSS